MTKRYSTRTLVLIVLVIAVAAAGVFADVSRSTPDYYCNGCTLPSNGTPAVSVTRYYVDNAMQTNNPVDWHIYLYNVGSGTQTCDYSGTNGYEGIKYCANTATARCQLLHNTGPTTATCKADY